jgi:hypothetical protein
MERYQLRVMAEKADLDVRLDLLTKYIDSNPQYLRMDEEQQDLLVRQRMIMEEYAEVLSERINTF